MQIQGLNNLTGGLGGGGGKRAGIAGIALFCLVVYLPGFFALPAVDREEARVAQASRQMYESAALPSGQRELQRGGKHSGGLVVPMLQDEPRMVAPPFIQWAQTASVAVFSRGNPYRDDIWMYRVPSLIAAICVVVLTRKLATLMFDAGAGGLAAVFVAVCPVMAWGARQATAEMVGVAWTMWAMVELWRVFAWGRVGSAETVVAAERPGMPGAVCFWIAIAGGFMSKGLMPPLVVAATAMWLCIAGKRWRWLLDLKPVLAVPMLGLAVGPWLWAVSQRVGVGTYLTAIIVETSGFGKDVAAQHSAPPGFHGLLMPLLAWPGSLLILLGLIVAWRLGRADRSGRVWRDGHPSYLFLIAWIVPGWALFEANHGKLPYSTMPIYPALAILGARAVLAAEAKALPGLEWRAARVWFIVWLVIGAAVSFAAIAGLVTRVAAFPSSLAGKVWAILVLLVSAGVMLSLLRAAWGAVMAGKFARGSVAAVMGMVVFWWVVPTMVLTRLLGLSSAIGGELARVDPGRSRPVAAVGYDADSLVFELRGKVELVNNAAVAEWVAAHPDGLLLRDGDQPSLAGTKAQELGRAAGLNLTTWRAQRLVIEEALR